MKISSSPAPIQNSLQMMSTQQAAANSEGTKTFESAIAKSNEAGRSLSVKVTGRSDNSHGAGFTPLSSTRQAVGNGDDDADKGHKASSLSEDLALSPKAADLNEDGVVDLNDLDVMKDNFFTDNAAADLNDDGIVNFLDLGIFKGLYEEANAPNADLNGDGIVNLSDLDVMKDNFFTDNAVADLNADGIVNFLDLGIFKSLFEEGSNPITPAERTLETSSEESETS